jgi:D-glycero-alpha-D-manno-heptose-7-phosphate kinase
MWGSMMPIDLREVLRGRVITASAPSRLDCGGTLDLRPLALQLERIKPSTATIAISLRTIATLRAGAHNTVVIESSGIGREEMDVESLPLTGPFSLLNAIIHHFGITGFQLLVHSDVPIGSGLGGSGAVAVTVIAAIWFALSRSSKMTLADRCWVANMAHQLENSGLASLTGLQDQLAAAFGGVNLWTWHYSDREHPYTRRVLIRQPDLRLLSERIAVAFTGELRTSTPVTAKYVEDYLAGKTRQVWIEISTWASEFGRALQDKDWGKAARALKHEMRLRDQICPHLWPKSALLLKAAAERHGCTARTGGGNRAGCVWSFGDPEAISALRAEWGTATLPAEVVSVGIEVRSAASQAM